MVPPAGIKPTNSDYKTEILSLNYKGACELVGRERYDLPIARLKGEGFNQLSYRPKMASVVGLKPTTIRLTGESSNQLSYTDKNVEIFLW